MVALYQSFHKIVYFQLILCAFLFRLNEDTVLCSTYYNESPSDSHNATAEYIPSTLDQLTIESTGKTTRI